MIGTIPACQSAIFRKAGLDMSKWGMGCTTAVVGRLSPFGRVEICGRHGDDGITSVACGGGGAAYLAAAVAGKPVLEQHGAQLYSLRPVPCAERDSISTSSACMIRQNTWACSPSMKLSLCGRDRPMVADADSSSQKVAWAIDHGIAWNTALTPLAISNMIATIDPRMQKGGDDEETISSVLLSPVSSSQTAAAAVNYLYRSTSTSRSMAVTAACMRVLERERM
ncbi:hypothetical protein GW17_00058692 [Ensete ventricosum]|nr:hypothetical protein GW17_00058692 [Ensete ventricosum]